MHTHITYIPACMHTNTYIHTYIHAYIHTYIHAYIQEDATNEEEAASRSAGAAEVPTHVCACICMYGDIHVYAYFPQDSGSYARVFPFPKVAASFW